MTLGKEPESCRTPALRQLAGPKGCWGRRGQRGSLDFCLNSWVHNGIIYCNGKYLPIREAFNLRQGVEDTSSPSLSWFSTGDDLALKGTSGKIRTQVSGALVPVFSTTELQPTMDSLKPCQH